MAYFNPIAYFIKSFIRLFTRKFFWLLLILFFIFLGFILFNNSSVFAESIYTIDNSFATDNIINTARTKIGDSIWNNEDYDIFITKEGNNIYCYYLNVKNYETLYPNVGEYCYNFVNASSINLVGYENGSFVRHEWTTDYPSEFHLIGVNNNYTTTSSAWAWLNVSVTNNVLPVYVVRSHYDIVDNTNNLILAKNTNFFRLPYIVTPTTDIESWSFDYLVISPGSYGFDIRNYYGIDIVHNTIPYTFDIVNYYNSSTGFFEIPRNVLSNDYIIRNGNSFRFYFSYREPVESGGDVQYIELGYYTISLTSSEQEEINQDSEKSVQGQMLSEQQKTNDKLDNIESSITDSNVDDITDDTLPSDNTNDITRDGVNGIFTSIYNAFCTGNAQDIVFPIPFTNKNITLQANYVNNMLSSNGAGWVVTIIQAFWWYLISRFIIKDVMDKINKIKSGNIEDIETTNIRGDML